jgi:hypothetical protein
MTFDQVEQKLKHNGKPTALSDKLQDISKSKRIKNAVCSIIFSPDPKMEPKVGALLVVAQLN